MIEGKKVLDILFDHLYSKINYCYERQVLQCKLKVSKNFVGKSSTRNK
jgi:hypothetical protein